MLQTVNALSLQKLKNVKKKTVKGKEQKWLLLPPLFSVSYLSVHIVPRCRFHEYEKRLTTAGCFRIPRPVSISRFYGQHVTACHSSPRPDANRLLIHLYAKVKIRSTQTCCCLS